MRVRIQVRRSPAVLLGLCSVLVLATAPVALAGVERGIPGQSDAPVPAGNSQVDGGPSTVDRIRAQERAVLKDTAPGARPVPIGSDDIGGFRWLDAGIGAVATIIVMALGAGAVMVARRGRGRPARL